MNETTHIVSVRKTNESDRNKHNCLGKNDRHYTGSIHFQRNVLSCTAILFITNDSLCILYRNFSCTLYQKNSSGNYDQQEYYFK